MALVKGRGFSYRVNIYNSAISGLFQPGGEVNDEAKEIARKVEARAIVKAEAFRRSGTVARSHRRNVVPSGIYGTRAYVYNTADHAEYKHNGTHNAEMISSPRGEPLLLRPGNGYGFLRKREVHGQTGDPWLLDAGNEVLLRYGTRAVPAP